MLSALSVCLTVRLDAKCVPDGTGTSSVHWLLLLTLLTLLACSSEYLDSHGSGAVCCEWRTEGYLHYVIHSHCHHLRGAVPLHVQDLLWWRRAGQHLQGQHACVHQVLRFHKTITIITA